MDNHSLGGPEAGHLSELDVAGGVEYRAFSTAALLGCIAGILSLLVLLAPWFWGVSLVAILLSLIGWRSVRNSPDARSGLAFAAVGLSLGVVALAASMSRQAVSDQLHKQTAEQVADRFVQAISAGELATAHQLMLPFQQRAADERSAAELYKSDEEAANTLAEFARGQSLAKLAGQSPQLLSSSTKTTVNRRATIIVSRVYEVADQKQSQVTVTLSRPLTPQGGKVIAWRVIRIE